ncbi:MAG TPA: response regulator transcription factor [Bryobacteraceae bacterium]|jgi:DNA-binding NarL/FixJ family response regulator
MGQIRIVLANHHPIVRTTLRALLERESGFEIVGEAANGREAVVLADYRRPDVVLLDIHLPIVNGICAASEILSRNPKAGIILVSSFADEEYVSQAFKAGVRGYVYADNAKTDLAAAVGSIAHGGSYLSPSIASQLPQITSSLIPG